MSQAGKQDWKRRRVECGGGLEEGGTRDGGRGTGSCSATRVVGSGAAVAFLVPSFSSAQNRQHEPAPDDNRSEVNSELKI